MRVLTVHNKYLIPGGEDKSHQSDMNLLRINGHEVIEYLQDNKHIAALGPLNTGIKTIWSTKTVKDINEIYRKTPFDIVHVQNFFPLISPSLFHVASKLGIPVIQNLRNYRLLCPKADFFRNNKICEECLNKVFPYPALKYRCYKESFLGSATVAMMLMIHRHLKTWTEKITFYLALTEFAKLKYVEGGIPAEMIRVRPNFLDPDPGLGDHQEDFFLFVGRLSKEKGIECLLDAFSKMDFKLKIIGEGPLDREVKAASESNPNIFYLGAQSTEVVLKYMKDAKALVFPSQWYEGMPRTIIEAFATGLPVISSNLGAMSTMISPYINGLHFTPGDAKDLELKIREFVKNDAQRNFMGIGARKAYEFKYNAKYNYQILKKIYNEAIGLIK